MMPPKHSQHFVTVAIIHPHHHAVPNAGAPMVGRVKPLLSWTLAISTLTSQPCSSFAITQAGSTATNPAETACLLSFDVRMQCSLAEKWSQHDTQSNGKQTGLHMLLQLAIMQSLDCKALHSFWRSIGPAFMGKA